MLDSEIIKAFECCYLGKDICEECPYFKENCASLASYEIPTQILALINRLTIDRAIFKSLCNSLQEDLKTAKAEAIKEFCEKRGIEYVETDI